MDKLISKNESSRAESIAESVNAPVSRSAFVVMLLRIIYVLGFIFAVFALALFLGGIYLIWDAKHSFAENIQKPCDNIVILTGGRYRIRHLLKIIRDSKNVKPKNIFISGVYSKTSLKDILIANMNLNDHQWLEKVEHCNFVLGKNARNTLENAEEVDKWVKKNSINQIVLITSDYHMRRSIIMLKYRNPELEIIPCSVRNQSKRYRTYLEEALKIIYTWITLHLTKK